MADIKYQLMQYLLFTKMNITDEIFDYLTRNISSQKTEEENFSAVWKVREFHQTANKFFKTSQKSEEEATRYRTEGNDFYKKRSFKKALEIYNLSIINAPHPVLPKVSEASDDSPHDNDNFVYLRMDPARYGSWTEEKSISLAMGYANRSAIMYELELYEKCLLDIDLAFRYGYPDHSRGKLEQRREKCLAAIKENASFDQNNAKALHSNHVTGKRRSSKGITTAKKVRLSPIDASLKKSLSSPKQQTPVIKEPNPNVVAHSQAIKISESPFGGMGFFATRNIRPGEVLAVERAYSVTLRENCLYTHCSTCTRACLTPLPCPGCSKVIFCNESCRNQGLAEDHWLDCRLLSSMNALELDKFTMSYKMLKTFSFVKMKDMLHRLQMEKRNSVYNSGINEDSIYNSMSFRAIYHLSTNIEKHTSMNLLWYCIVAFILTKFLKTSGRYFVNEEGDAVDPTEADLVQTGALLLNHIMKEQINSFQNGYIEEWIGFCIFPTVSLVNHSCNPSLGFFMSGREIVLRALRPISSGEELTISYTFSYAEKTKDYRTKFTQASFFQCYCEACVGNWPTLSNLPEIKVRCFECLTPQREMNHICHDCKAQGKGDPQTRIEILHSIKEATVRSNQLYSKRPAIDKITEKDYHQLLEDIELMYKYLASPNRLFNNLRINLKNCIQAGF